MKSGFGRDDLRPDSPQRYLSSLQEYRETVLRLFPELGRQVLDGCPISTADALFLGCFLDHYSRRVVALEMSTCAGAAAFWLASHPKVSRVTSINPNPPVTGTPAELAILRSREGDESSGDPGVLVVARAALEEHPEEREKIAFLEGRVNELPAEAARLPEDGDPVALVDDPGTRREVAEGLVAIFDANPRAVVFLDDCRRERGPFVQAGVADFLDASREEHRFRLVADLGPSFASSGMGVMYPGVVAAEMERALKEVDRAFSRKLDPLRLLSREEELMRVVSKLNRQRDKLNTRVSGLNTKISGLKARTSRLETWVSGLKDKSSALNTKASRLKTKSSRLEAQIASLETQIASLEAHNAELLSRYSSRRYRLVDALAERVLRVPTIKKLARMVHSPSGKG